MKLLPSRQVHLDFHTSERIENVGEKFDAEAFAQQMKQAHVDSVTVFALCHHGWLYYPSQKFPHCVHPHLACPDLLLQQIRALHAQGIKAPVYLAVQWARQIADTHPEWLIRHADGSHEGGPFTEPGFYQSLCVNTGYGTFLEALVIELAAMLGDALDGFFFDIVSIRPCVCTACRHEMLEKGMDPSDEEQVRAFAAMTMDRFKERMSNLVRQHAPDASIFYNSGHAGPFMLQSADAYTHFELESLPSGVWGYLHFPVAAKYARTLGKDCQGMTGKFHTSWGDFHSLKNRAALEFECLRMLSYGFACSIGDQMEPRGTLNPATYRRIGEIYEKIARYEPWARPSVARVEAALVTSESYRYEQQIPESVMGAAQLLDELGLQYDIIDQRFELDAKRWPLLLLADDLHLQAAFERKLDAYVQAGGCVVAFGENLTEDGRYPACFGVEHLDARKPYPDFLLPSGFLCEGLEEDAPCVMYRQGQAVQAREAIPLVFACGPYFQREGSAFCSHQYAPCAYGETYPVAFQNGNVLLFAHPLFSQYRQCAPLWCKLLVRNAILKLRGGTLVETDGPSTMLVSLLHQPQQRRYCLHLLNYVPVRKSATIDIIEEPTPVDQLHVRLRVPESLKRASVAPEGAALALCQNAFTLPCMPGYCVVALDY